MTAAVAEAASLGAHPTFADGSDAVSRYIGSITDWDREALAARDRVSQKESQMLAMSAPTPPRPFGWPDDPRHRRSSRHRRHASGISPRRRRHGYRRRLGDSRARVR